MKNRTSLTKNFVTETPAIFIARNAVFIIVTYVPILGCFILPFILKKAKRTIGLNSCNMIFKYSYLLIGIISAAYYLCQMYSNFGLDGIFNSSAWQINAISIGFILIPVVEFIVKTYEINKIYK